MKLMILFIALNCFYINLMEATFYSKIANERMTSKVNLLTENIKSKFDFEEFNVWSHQDSSSQDIY